MLDMPGQPLSASTRRPTLQHRHTQPRRWHALVHGLAWMLLWQGPAGAQLSPLPVAATAPGGTTAGLDVAVIAAAVGRDVARRWCAGENPKQAIEQAMLADLSGRRIGPDGLPEATLKALGREISVEAFAQAFAGCPQTARRVFRTLLQ